MNVTASGGPGLWGMAQAITMDKDLMAAVLAARPAVAHQAQTAAAAVALVSPVDAGGHVDVYA
jgi:hypothetical protein